MRTVTFGLVVLAFGLLVWALFGARRSSVRIRCWTVHERAAYGLVRMRDAVETFASEEGGPPETLDDVLPSLGFRSIPLDPWRSEYFYVPPLDDGVWVLLSFGSDTRPGGVGDAADLEVHPEAPVPHLVTACPAPPARGPLWARPRSDR